MIKLPSTFKFRHDQEEKAKEILSIFREKDDVGFIAPTDYGKMIVACVVAISQNFLVTYVTYTYESIQDVIKTLEMLGKLKELFVVCPMGKYKTRKAFCKEDNCKSCSKNKIAIPVLRKKDSIGMTSFSVTFCKKHLRIKVCPQHIRTPFESWAHHIPYDS